MPDGLSGRDGRGALRPAHRGAGRGLPPRPASMRARRTRRLRWATAPQPSQPGKRRRRATAKAGRGAGRSSCEIFARRRPEAGDERLWRSDPSASFRLRSGEATLHAQVGPPTNDEAREAQRERRRNSQRALFVERRGVAPLRCFEFDRDPVGAARVAARRSNSRRALPFSGRRDAQGGRARVGRRAFPARLRDPVL